MVGGGFIRPNEQWDHSVPLPAVLHAQTCWRRLVVTLAWFTPTHPSRREYRSFALRVGIPRENLLRAVGIDADGKATTRGTVQHEVLYEGSEAMDIGSGAALTLPVTCFDDATSLEVLPPEGIPYAIAVTVEVAPETGLAIYEEIRARVQPPVLIQP